MTDDSDVGDEGNDESASAVTVYVVGVTVSARVCETK